MSLPQYVHGAAQTEGCAVFIGLHRVAKLVYVPEATRECDRLLVLTDTGDVYQRAIDGRMSARLPVWDLFYDPTRRDAPVVIKV